MVVLVYIIILGLCTPVGECVLGVLGVLALAFGLAVMVLGILANPWPVVEMAGLVLFACAVLDWLEQGEQRTGWRW